MNWCGVFSSSSSSSSSSFVKGSRSYLLVKSKHDVKCQRVSRIISRRIYSCQRRESVRQQRDSSSSSGILSPSSEQTRSSSPESLTNETDVFENNAAVFSPEKLTLPNVRQTLSRFSVKHSKRRIYSSDPQTNSHIMNKSSIVHHSLIKRRYSAPETVTCARKPHKTTSKSKSIDGCSITSTKPIQSSYGNSYSTENNLKDKSCQTNSIKHASSHRISAKCCQRDSNCYSYCRAQRDRHIQPMPQSCFEFPPTENYWTIPQRASYLRKSDSDWSLNDSNSGTTLSRAHSYPAPKSFSFPKHQSRPSVDALDYEKTLNLLEDVCDTSKQISQNATNVFKPCPPSIVLHPDSGNKSVNRKINCYDTVRVNSAVNQTPYRDNNFKSANRDVFPITFHSESVFLQPYKKGGFLSRKELHHISINVIPDVDTTFQSSHTTNASDKFKTEIKLDINDNDNTATEPSKTIFFPRPNVGNVFNQLATMSNSTPPPTYPDCSVSIDDYPLKLPFAKLSELRIHINVSDVDLSNSFCEPISGSDDDNNDSVTRRVQSHVRLPSGNYNPKTAMNFLFQKLRNSYPRRQFLKPLAFQEPQTGGVYYSNLPDAIPTICNEEKAQRWRRRRRQDDILSDSDTSIADSLEDVQTTRTKLNSYEKYDTQLAVDEASLDTEERYEREITHKDDGITYFLPLELGADNHFASVKMPERLEMKLKSRQRRLPKHELCFDNGSKESRTSSKNENRWKQSRRKKLYEYGDELSSSEKKSTITTRKTGSKTDEEIMNVLLEGLKAEEEVTATLKRNDDNYLDSKQTVKMATCTRSVQTDRPTIESNENRIVNEYDVDVEMIEISSPAEETLVHDGDDNYEILQSEEETARINSTNYYKYKSVKKFRKIYHRPMKKPFQSGGSTRSRSRNTFELEGANDVKKSNGNREPFEFDFVSNSNSNSISNTLKNLPAMKKMGENRSRGNAGNEQSTKMSGCTRTRTFRTRPRPFCQQFEAIPEEMTNACAEKATNREPQPLIVIGLGENSTTDDADGDSSKELSKNERIIRNGTETDAIANDDASAAAIEFESEIYTAAAAAAEDETTSKKSRKGRDSSTSSPVDKQEVEEPITRTLSEGWINFYLLNTSTIRKYADADENNVNEDNINVCGDVITETRRLSPLYTIHVHATPEIQARNTPPRTAITAGAVLPGIRNESQKFVDQKLAFVRSKLSHRTNLPDIRAASVTSKSPETVPSAAVNLQKTCGHVLPKLGLNCCDMYANEDVEKYERTNENDRLEMKLMAQRKPTFDNLESVNATSSNQSESSVEKIHPCRKGRYKKSQKYNRPCNTHNRWSMTIEGSEHDDKSLVASNIEMQLSLKKSRTGTHSNQSWKFSITNEETSRTNDIEEYETNGRYLPHLNVNCRVPFPICYGDENTSKYCEKNSGNSSLSLQGKNFVEKCSDRKFGGNISRFDSDLRLRIRTSEDDLTVIGSTITPERKPHVPTMSERDLYRMKLI